MKKVIFFLILFSMLLPLKSQSVLWLKNFQFASAYPGTMTSVISSMETDSLGFLYTFGGYQVDGGQQYYDYTFLNKLDSAGNEMFRDTTQKWGAGPREMETDGNHLYAGANIYLRKLGMTGNLQWSLDGQVNSSNITGVDDMAYYEGFLYVVFKNWFLKYDIAGNLIWTKQVNQNGSLQIEKANPGCFYIKSGDGNSYNIVVISKYDSAGNSIWAVPVPGYLNFDGNISSDASGDCYLTGSYQGTASFGNNTLYCKVCSTWDCYIAKLSSAGSWVWARNIQKERNFLLYGAPSENYLFTGEIDSSSNTIICLYDKQGNYIKGVPLPPATNFYVVRDIKKYGSSIYVGGYEAGQYTKAFLARIDDSSLGVCNASGGGAANELFAFPNPCDKLVIIRYVSSQKGKLGFILRNWQGSVLHTEECKEFTGEHSFQLSMSVFPKGIYFVEMQQDGIRKTLRIVKD